MRQIKYIVVHCTATSRAASVASILNGWKQLGWKKPGYHFLVEAKGAHHILLPVDKVSNGVKGYNSVSINLAYIGGIDKAGKPLDNITPMQRWKLQQIIDALLVHFPNAKVVGHRDLSPDTNKNGKIDPQEWLKACPCFDVTSKFNIPKQNRLS